MNPLAKLEHDFSGRRVAVFGLGLLGRGVSVARTLAKIGCRVVVNDEKPKEALRLSLRRLQGLPITIFLGENREDEILKSDVIVRNPAVPWQHPILEKARGLGTPIVMDTSLFARYFPGTIVGVTGTRGKTTTTLLTFTLLKKTKGDNVFLGGNATNKANIALLENTTANHIAVMELSSWELEGFREEKLSPQVAVVTNIYPDHLNRYRSLHEYVHAKEAIFEFQRENDVLVLNRHNRYTRAMAKCAPGKVRWFSEKDVPRSWTLKLPGSHNRENAAAAYQVGKLFSLSESILRYTLCNFPGFPHRLETVAVVRGVTFINDTTSTTPTATLKALASFSQPIILLLGGNSKNLPLGKMIRAVSKRTKTVILLEGDATGEVRKALESQAAHPQVVGPMPLTEAVRKAYELASPGNIVLLSPGFTSFAEFNNEFERGECFRSAVRRLKRATSTDIHGM